MAHFILLHTLWQLLRYSSDMYNAIPDLIVDYVLIVSPIMCASVHVLTGSLQVVSVFLGYCPSSMRCTLIHERALRCETLGFVTKLEL